jgi:hypothetical protein
MSKPKSFVIHLDVNEGFAIRTSTNPDLDKLQAVINGEDGKNLEIGKAIYALGEEELSGIVSDIVKVLTPYSTKKTFLVGATVSDGGYEHYSHGLIEADSLEEALAKAEPHKDAYFSWEGREDEVEVTLEEAREVTPAEVKVLLDTHVAGYI